MLPTLGIDGDDPPLRRLGETGIDHDQVRRVLDPHGVIIDEDLNDLRPEGRLNHTGQSCGGEFAHTRVLTVHVRMGGAPHDGGIDHPALDAKTAFSEMLPGMAALDGRPADGQLLQARTEGSEDLPMVTDPFLGSAPLGYRLVTHLDHLTEIVPLDAAGTHDRPTLPVEDHKTIQPLARDLDEIPDVDAPHVMGCRRVLGPFSGMRAVVLA